MAAISSSSGIFSHELRVRAYCAAEESAGTNSSVKEVQQKPSQHHFFSGRVALFLGAPTRQNGQSGMSMLHGVLERNAAALAEVCPELIPTNEVALTQFVLKEVRSGTSERLIRCLDAGLFSVVHDVLFFQGRFREGILEQLTDQTVNELFSKSVDKGAAQLLTLLLSQDPFHPRIFEGDLRLTFCRAAANGQLKCLQALLYHEGIVDRLPDYTLGSALCSTAEHGLLECLQAFLDHEGIVDRLPESQLGFALILATRYGHLECLQVLLDHESIVDRISGFDLGWALENTAQNGHPECLQALLDHESIVDRIPDNKLGSALRSAAERGLLECLQALLANDKVAARIPDQALVEVLKPVVNTDSHIVLTITMNALALFNEYYPPSQSIHSLLLDFNFLFSTDMYADVLAIYGGTFPIETPEQKNALKESITHVLVGYARENGDSVRKQQATRFLHSIWEMFGSPETDEGLDFGPNHMWDSLSAYREAFLDCLTI